MIVFNYETKFELSNETILTNWLQEILNDNSFTLGEINYIFCDDAYLHKLNIEFLDHDTLTDIISFDNTIGKTISGDIFISVQRVKENAKEFNVTFAEELHRVMIHGVLHYMGYKDKTETQKIEMRLAEDTALSLLKV